MKTQNLRLNVQPLANYVCKVQFAWQASELEKKYSPRTYLHDWKYWESSLEVAQEIHAELWHAFGQPLFIFKNFVYSLFRSFIAIPAIGWIKFSFLYYFFPL